MSQASPIDAAAGGGDVDTTALLTSADQLRWSAPEIALHLVGRYLRAIDEQPELAAAGDLAVAHALLSGSYIRLHRHVDAVEPGLVALRIAEQAGERQTAALARLGLAACARELGEPVTAIGLLEPVLRPHADPLPLCARAVALTLVVGCAANSARRDDLEDALEEAHRLVAADPGVTTEMRRLERAQLQAETAAYRRRHGEPEDAVEAAKAGLAELRRMGRAWLDAGQVRGRLTAELVCALLDEGGVTEATEEAERLLGEPVRATTTPWVGRVLLMMADRVHVPAGRTDVARTMVAEAARLAGRHGLTRPLADALAMTAELEESAGRPSEALVALHSARQAERNAMAAGADARRRLAARFGDDELQGGDDAVGELLRVAIGRPAAPATPLADPVPAGAGRASVTGGVAPAAARSTAPAEPSPVAQPPVAQPSVPAEISAAGTARPVHVEPAAATRADEPASRVPPAARPSTGAGTGATSAFLAGATLPAPRLGTPTRELLRELIALAARSDAPTGPAEPTQPVPSGTEAHGPGDAAVAATERRGRRRAEDREPAGHQPAAEHLVSHAADHATGHSAAHTTGHTVDHSADHAVRPGEVGRSVLGSLEIPAGSGGRRRAPEPITCAPAAAVSELPVPVRQVNPFAGADIGARLDSSAAAEQADEPGMAEEPAWAFAPAQRADRASTAPPAGPWSTGAPGWQDNAGGVPAVPPQADRVDIDFAARHAPAAGGRHSGDEPPQVDRYAVGDSRLVVPDLVAPARTEPARSIEPTGPGHVARPAEPTGVGELPGSGRPAGPNPSAASYVAAAVDAGRGHPTPGAAEGPQPRPDDRPPGSTRRHRADAGLGDLLADALAAYRSAQPHTDDSRANGHRAAEPRPAEVTEPTWW